MTRKEQKETARLKSRAYCNAAAWLKAEGLFEEHNKMAQRATEAYKQYTELGGSYYEWLE